MRNIIAGAFVVVVSFVGTLWATGTFQQSETPVSRPKLAELPPLQPVTRASLVVAPTAIALTAIRDAMEAAAPRDLSGQSSNPVSEFLSKNEIGVTMARGPISVGARGEGLAISTPLNGKLRVTGKLATQAGKLTGSIGGLIDSSFGKQVENLTGKVLDQSAEVRGDVTVTSRPAITPLWRLNPNLAAQVNVGNNAMSVSGFKISVAKEAKPLIDKVVNEQMAALDTRLRNDPFIETVARREWAKMCRAIPLGGGGSSLPELWLELRPTRAFTAQPRIEANNLILTVGVQAETRIVDKATKPSCPFPARLEGVPQTEQGRLAIAVPIDLPFGTVSKLLEAQLMGRRFPEDGSGAVDVEVRRAAIAASGDRLLIALRVKARERKSWFGFGAEADVYVWGRPELDRDKQILRLADIELAVESEAAFGLLGAAARAAMPYLQDALAQNAVIDLKPFTTDARKKIGAALADFRQDSDGVRIDAAIRDLRLIGIEFDSKTLRVITEANGTVRVAVTKLAGM
ncbi:MAG: DUF4403 family protein [Xanthobacteraceae bacterium]